MTAALVSVNAGVATVYSSGDLSALAGVSALSAIVVTRTAQTPAGDPVVVDLSSGLAGVNALSSVTVENGATAEIGGGLLNAGVGTAVNVNGGILDIEGQAIGAQVLNAVTVGPDAGEIKVEPTGLSVSLLDIPVNFVDANGNPTTTIPKNFVMDFPSSSSIPASYDPATNTTTIGDGVSLLGLLGAGRTITLSGDPFDLEKTGTANYGLLGNITSYTHDFTQSDGSGGVITCFLTNSMIRTPSGDVAIQDIGIGDQVITFDWRNNTEIPREVTWAGSQTVVVRPDLPDDEAGYPVRILKDAIADGVPYKDMLVTAEHCLFFDAKFVPVRMFVNGRSIFYDKSITSYDYYHIETAQHSVIMADGMLTETYLDTGHRRTFRQKGKVVAFAPSRNLTWADAAAPLGVSRAFVEPLFHQVAARAQAAGIAQKEATAELTDDANLHLLTDTGAVIRQAREHEGRVMFMIPTGVKSVRIVSSVSRPSDVIGPFVDDRRYLGLAIGEVTMFEAAQSHAVTPHLTEQDLDGWHTLDRQDMRWTSGNALLPLGPRHPNSAALLALQIREKGSYPIAQPTHVRTAKRA